MRRISVSVARLFVQTAFALLLVAGAVPHRVAAGPEQVTEYEVKAAFLYNFSRFVSWPSQPAQTFRLCVLGENPFGQALDSLIGKPVNKSVLVIEEHREASQATHCQLVFISRSQSKKLKETIAELRQHPVLTVSDIESFTAAGGMIGLSLSANRIRFDINLHASGVSGLSISSKLLSLAKNVTSEQ